MPSAAIGEFDDHDAVYPGHRWHAVMHTIVATARAHGLRCMDGPYAGYNDLAGLERACQIARAMGFDGKECIHPKQLPIVNETFSPTPDDIAKAEALVAAYEAAVAKGQGAATHDGRMIDAANVRMAQTILERRRLIGSS
jgi:citrate lyase beta subunit